MYTKKLRPWVKIFIGIVIAIVLLQLLLNLNKYNRYGTVEIVDGTRCVVDNTGNIWDHDDIYKFSIGDKVVMEMNDKGTTSIYDDEIISIEEDKLC